jgi:hypothetical protein
MKPGAWRAVNLLNQSGQLVGERAVWLLLRDERKRRLVTAAEERVLKREEFALSPGQP